MLDRALVSVAAFGFDAPRWGLLLPVALAALLLLERRLPGTTGRRARRLLLRSLVLALVTAAVARPHWDAEEEAPRLLVVARDERALGAPGARAEADAAAQAALVAARSAGIPAVETSSPDGGPATLAAARLALPAGSTGTVLWLTDGRSVPETVRSLLDEFARESVRVEGVALPHDVSPPLERARVVDLVAPAEARGPFAARARIAAPGTVEVDLLVDGESVRTVASPGSGERDVAFDDLEATAGPHEIAVRVRSPDGEGGGPLPVARTVVRVGDPPRILAVLEDPQSSPARRAVSSRGFTVAAVPAEELGAALSAIAKAQPADAFLLDAAAAARASPQDLDLLARHVEAGAGLFLEAGGSREAWERLSTSPLARVLPVAPVAAPPPAPPPAPEETPPPPEPPQPDPSPGLRADRRPEEALPISLLLVVDRSGSMAGGKLAMAIEGARRAAATLSAFDRAGVITFADEPSLDVPLESAVGLRDLGFRLLSLKAGGNTDLYGAMRLAASVLGAERSPIRHMIVLTDGGQNVGAPIFGPLVQALNAQGVTLTLVGLGYGHDEQLLKRIWQFSARGTYVPVDTARELPTILTRDTMRVADDRAREARAMARIPDPERPPAEPPTAPRKPPAERPEPRPPPGPPAPADAGPGAAGTAVPLRLLRPHEATAGVARDGLPKVGPPRAATGVPGAALLLARDDGAIVLAAGRFGLGRSLAWLLPPDDAGANGWPDLGAVLVQGVRSVLAPEGATAGGTSPSVLAGPDGEVLRIDRSGDGDPEPLTVEWRGTDAEGRPARRPLPPVRPGEEVSLPHGQPGTLATVLLATSRGERLPAVTYAVRDASADPARAGDASALEDLLGRGPADPARLPSEMQRVRRTRRTPIWMAFLLAAVALLPLDVAAHRRSAPAAGRGTSSVGAGS